MSKNTWLAFKLDRDTGKTKVWSVHNIDNGGLLGQVSWYSPWRQYCYSNAGIPTIWNKDCLQELQDFIAEQMAAHKKQKETDK